MNNIVQPINQCNKKHSLVRWDLIEFEHYLYNSLKQIIPFESYALYFPQEDIHKQPEWITEEKKLLIPLYHNGEFLGVFMAKNLKKSDVGPLLPILPNIIELCLTNLELYKKNRLDILTGLIHRQIFIQKIAEEIRYIQTSFNHNMYGSTEDNIPHKSSLGVIIIRFDGLKKLSRETTYGFTENFIANLAQTFIQSLPKQAIPARTGDYEFALLLPEAKSTQCEELASSIMTVVKDYKQYIPLTDKQTKITPHIGYSIYPQDLDGSKHLMIDNHANILLHKASLAAEVAQSRLNNGIEQIIAYGRILYEGGEVQQILPFSRIITNLGRSVGAREGQRFSIWSTKYITQADKKYKLQAVYKGEIVLIEIHDSDSIGEIIHLGDPTNTIEPGDTLMLLEKEQTIPTQQSDIKSNNEHGHNYDPTTGLFSHSNFLIHYSNFINTCSAFTLVLLHIDSKTTHTTMHKDPNHIMGKLIELYNNCINLEHTPLFGGRFALNSLIFCHSSNDVAALQKHYITFCKEATNQINICVSAGIAPWPFLNFRASDTLDCCRKALEYALLLPPPHVGIFDSLAINISADKKHCYGDTFSAIEEYKLALLADDTNGLAWNSLGVCMASIGYHNDALNHFKKALDYISNDPTVFYNLGVLHQTLKDTKSAQNYFTKCLELSPTHVYALIRLGEVALLCNQQKQAITYFKQAITVNDKNSLPYRHLAKIVLQEGNKEKAREYLHQALLQNPRDAAALTFMAKLYLDDGEDPELAEALARQSVSQRPNSESGWFELARSLEAQGKDSEAFTALTKAKEYMVL